MMLPPQLYSAAQVRQLEGRLIAAGTSGPVLMERAGAAAYACLRARWPAVKSIAVVCGGGNNGGDGKVVARLAQQDGLAVRILAVGFEPAQLLGCELVVDALLGIGMRAPLSAQMVTAINAINGAGLPVLAIDLPSGLEPDSGKAAPAVRATATLTFIALKQGLFIGDGPDCAGEVMLEPLGIEAAMSADLEPALLRLTDADVPRSLAPRSRQGHKGQFGRVVVVGGGVGMPGAVCLAAESALRVGAGLVTVASRPEHLQVVVGTRPELMFHAIAGAGDVPRAIAGADVVLIGPGLGRDAWGREVLSATLSAVTPETRLVVDADALNLIAEGVGQQKRDGWILTPHPAEAARLLRTSTDEVQRDRMAALRTLCAQRGGTIVLKGATTLVGRSGEITRVCDRGNPGMAVPGMGDVLAGAIAGILAQGRDPFLAAAAAVHVHASAGDNCARAGLRGILATDVALEMRAVLAALP
jgi:ADP-dependent NAD(P)H-hydrate dehydratase / NAD(P)H-hydrate epimerase